MKLKTYFGPKLARAFAVLLLLLALVYAAVTALDVLQTPSGFTEKLPQILTQKETERAQKELLVKSLPPHMRNTPEGRRLLAAQKDAQEHKQEPKEVPAAKPVEKAVPAQKTVQEKNPAAMEEMGEKISDIIGDCRSQNKEWFACTTDKECVEIIGVCGARDAANRAFRVEVQNCNRSAAADLACWPFALSRIVPRCIKGVCTAQQQEAKPAPTKP